MPDDVLRELVALLNADPQALDSLENSNFFIVDYVGNRHKMSHLMHRTGLRHDDEGFRNFMSKIHPEDLPTYRSIWQRVTDGLENEMQAEYRLEHAPGEWMWLRTHCMVLTRQADGAPALLIGMDADITARKQHETNQQDELHFYKSRLLQLEQWKEAERAIPQTMELGKLDTLLRSTRSVLQYDLLRVLQLKEGSLVMVGCDSPPEGVSPLAGYACHDPDDTAMAEETLHFPIPRIRELNLPGQPFHSWLGVPLLDGDKAFGVLEFFHHVPGCYHSEHIWSAKALGEHLARTILTSMRFQQARSEAYRDPLTGLFNRRYLEELFMKDKLYSEASLMSLIVIDIDLFKQVNDQEGHAVGDQVIKAVVGTMQAVFRRNDVLCRYGGDEFLVLLPHTSLDASQAIAERFRQLITRTNVEGLRHGLSISAGISCLPAFRPERFDELFAAADKALYESKQAGRNRVSVHAVLD